MENQRNNFFSVSSRSIVLASSIITCSFTGLEAAKLSDVINNASIEGFAFGRVTAVDGRDGKGVRYQFRFKPTITSGAVYGVSASAGIFFSKGSSTPDNNSADDDIGGSRGQTILSLVDRFNIGDFYVTFDGKETLNTKTNVKLGQKSPGTPFNDNNLDRALGVFIENNDVDIVNFGFQWWDSWMGDDIYISLPNITFTGAGIGNNMFMFYAKSGANFTKETGISYNLWYGLIHRWVNAMIFGDVAYTMGFDNKSLTFTGQISFTSMASDPFIFSSYNAGNGASNNTNNAIYSSSNNLVALFNHNSSNWYAKNRGMANIRVDYKYNLAEAGAKDGEKAIGFFGAAAGIAFSFGDGFGTLIDNTGGLKLGGHLWNSYSGAEANGFGILGVGGFKNSSIVVPYLKAEVGYKKFGAALDLAYVNASHFFYLARGSREGETNLNTVAVNLYGSKNYIKPASFLDIALSATYNITDSINMLAAYGYAFGKPQFGRFRFQVNYVF